MRSARSCSSASTCPSARGSRSSRGRSSASGTWGTSTTSCSWARSPASRWGSRSRPCRTSAAASWPRWNTWKAKRAARGKRAAPPEAAKVSRHDVSAQPAHEQDRAVDNQQEEQTMKCIRIVAAAVAAAVAGSSFAADITLRASHQFPGGKGDVRDEMVQMIARDAKAANVGLEVQVYPGASLFKATEQWNALVNGQLDISSFPLDYASGKVREFGATLMPGLVRSHERAQRMAESPFMKDIRAKIDKAGVVVLADAWLAGAVASKKGCVR